MFETQIKPNKETTEMLEKKIETLVKAAQAAKIDGERSNEERLRELNSAGNQLKAYISRMCSRAFKYGQENRPAEVEKET